MDRHMLHRSWLATPTGLRVLAEPDAAPDDAALQERCRAGDIVVTARAWRTEVHACPVALAREDAWPAALAASLPEEPADLTLNVLCSTDWHVSPHGSAAGLAEELAAWVRLHRHAVRRSRRLTPAAAAGLPRLDGLLRALAERPAASAAELLGRAPAGAGALEALLAVLGGAPAPDSGSGSDGGDGAGGLPPVLRLDAAAADSGAAESGARAVPRLAVPDIYLWLAECHLTGMVIVAETAPQWSAGIHAEAASVLIFPVEFQDEWNKILAAVGAVFVSPAIDPGAICS